MSLSHSRVASLWGQLRKDPRRGVGEIIPGESTQLLSVHLQMDISELPGTRVASREQLGQGYLPLFWSARVQALKTPATGPRPL